MYPCFFIGISIRKNWDLIVKNKLVFAALALATYLFFYIKDWNITLLQTHHLVNSASQGAICQNCEVVYFRLVRIVVGVSASMVLILLFHFTINKASGIWKSISKYGELTLGIYILQSLLLERIMPRLINWNEMTDVMYDYMATPLISIFVIIVSVEIVKLIKQNSIVALFLLGQTKKQGGVRL